MKNSKKINQICFKNFLKELRQVKTHKELVILSNKVENGEFLGVFEKDAQKMLKNKFKYLRKQHLKKDCISCCIPKYQEPLIFNLKGLDGIEKKINKVNSPILKFEFEGLFNLLNDKNNLLYNPLFIRDKIIKDLNKFKSLKFFKIGYVSRYNLKNEFKYLSFKNDATIGHTKIYFIKNGLYVMKTLKKDDISLKVFYIGKKYKTLLKSSNNVKRTLKGEKFNLSSTEAYKVLNKKDSIKYYSYCNSNCLDKKNRQLLRDIRKSKKISRDSLIESLEDKMEDLEDSINNKVLSETDKIYLELQFQDCEKFLSDLKSHDEDNSLEGETTLDDYF